jgi:DNA-binding CsgD family transcriptional regulator
MTDPANAGLSEGYAALAEILFASFSAQQVRDEALASARAHAKTDMPAEDVQGLTLSLCARVMIRAEDLGGAREVLDSLDPFLAKHAYPWHLGAHAELSGLLVVGKSPEAAASFTRAADLYEQAQSHVDRVRSLRLFASVAQDPQERLDALQQARRLAVECGALAELNRIESQLRQLGVRPRAGRPKGARRAAGELSSREQEVAVLVAGGATNAEIAARLFLSERTVEDHIAKATRRLGISGRAGLAAWAAKRGLI